MKIVVSSNFVTTAIATTATSVFALTDPIEDALKGEADTGRDTDHDQ